MRQLGFWSFHWYRAATRFLLLFLALILLYSLFGASSGTAAEKEEKKVLRVAFVQLPGFTQTAEDGTRYGVVVDYLNEIAKYTGWEYEYVDTEGTGFLDGFSNGEYDLMGATYYLPEMTGYYAYPDYSCGSTKSILLARHDDERIKGFEARYLDGKTIGVYANANENIRRLEEFLKMNGIDCRLKRYTLDQLVDGKMYAHLENGEVDLLLENAAGNDDRFRVVASFDAQPHYIVTTPDRPEVLEGLNMALEKILDANPNFAEERYAANFPKLDQVEVFLNAEEQAYIQEKQVITVAVPEQFHPLVCLREKEMIHSGLVPDMLDKVTNFSALRFEYVFTDSYTGALELVQQGQADMAGFYLDGENSALQMGLSLTKSYATLDNLIVRNKFVSYPGAGLRCTVLDGRKLPNTVHADQVTYYSDISKALSAVNRGEQDFAYGLSVGMEQQIQKNYLSNVVPVTLFNDSSKVSFALAKPAPPQLLTILNKAIYHLTEEEKRHRRPQSDLHRKQSFLAG